jgi:hypothetical protein
MRKTTSQQDARNLKAKPKKSTKPNMATRAIADLTANSSSWRWWFPTKSLRTNRADVSTLEEVLEAVECKHGRARWGMGNSPSTRSFVAISHIPEFVLPKALLAPDVPGSRFRDQIARNVLRRKGRGALLPTACIANACRARANIRDAHG